MGMEEAARAGAVDAFSARCLPGGAVLVARFARAFAGAGDAATSGLGRRAVAVFAAVFFGAVVMEAVLSVA